MMVSHKHDDQDSDRCPHCRIRKFLSAALALLEDADDLASNRVADGLLATGFVDARGGERVGMALELARIAVMSAGCVIEDAFSQSNKEKDT